MIALVMAASIFGSLGIVTWMVKDSIRQRRASKRMSP